MSELLDTCNGKEGVWLGVELKRSERRNVPITGLMALRCVCVFALQCVCWPGFRLKTDGRTCVDVNECVETFPCSQQCMNTYGSYKCVCADGYKPLETDTHSCRAVSGTHTHSFVENEASPTSFKCSRLAETCLTSVFFSFQLQL